jgi:hypothetical protein
MKASIMEKLMRYVPMIVVLITAIVIITIPLQIMSYGYLPQDDAMRHAAKAVSGKPWSEILVMRDDFQIDHNFGWHVFLREIHLKTGIGTDGLVTLSVALLFLLFGFTALPFLKRPEAWLASLLLVMLIEPSTAHRFFLGRPFLLTITGLMMLLWFWRLSQDRRPRALDLAVITGTIALCVFVHGCWYLWVIPLLSLLAARQFAWGLTFGLGWLSGSFLGACFTGQPIRYLLEAVQIALFGLGKPLAQRTMVTEFMPFDGHFLTVVVFLAVLYLLKLGGRTARSLLSDPIFWLICLSWILGFKTVRFWKDWGLPALLVFVTWEFNNHLCCSLRKDYLGRLVLTLLLGTALYLAYTGDRNSRWTDNLTVDYLSAEKPDLVPWLPEKGGILYSSDMGTFYHTFFKNPRAEWRYLLGFEATLMPEKDFRVLQNILWNFDDPRAFKPWIQQMRKEDRLVMPGLSFAPPPLRELEWYYAATRTWIGRLPRTNTITPTGLDRPKP